MEAPLLTTSHPKSARLANRARAALGRPWIPSLTRRAIAALVLVTLLCPGVGLHAQPRPKPQVSAQDKAEAKSQFKRGEALYKAKKFKPAAEAYEAAYEHLPLPAFLFNIGQCYRNLGRYVDAVTMYRRYLEDAPEAPNRQRVEELLTELEPKARAEKEAAGGGVAARPREPVEASTASATGPLPGGVDLRLPSDATQGGGRVDVDLQARSEGATSADEGDAPHRPIWKRWWFWAGAGAVVAGGTVAAILLLSGRLPSSDLGNLDLQK